MSKETNNQVITEALEDYLVAIYTASLGKTSVRITDIALALGLSKPSVNRAVGVLKAAGMVEHEPYGDIVLTPKGIKKGAECYNKRKSITQFFVKVLDMENDAAESEANKIEHGLSINTIDRMVNFMSN